MIPRSAVLLVVLAASKLPRSGTGEQLLAYCGIDASAICAKAEEVVGQAN